MRNLLLSQMCNWWFQCKSYRTLLAVFIGRSLNESNAEESQRQTQLTVDSVSILGVVLLWFMVEMGLLKAKFAALMKAGDVSGCGTVMSPRVFCWWLKTAVLPVRGMVSNPASLGGPFGRLTSSFLKCSPLRDRNVNHPPTIRWLKLRLHSLGSMSRRSMGTDYSESLSTVGGICIFADFCSSVNNTVAGVTLGWRVVFV